MVKVELVFIPKDSPAIHKHLMLASGACVMDVIQQSGLLRDFPEIKDSPVGVFGRQVALDAVVKDGDRLEIYRSLLIDPKEKRRRRSIKK